jgi:hypothetical protein
MPPGRLPGLPSAGLRAPPAGAASGPIFEASLEDALGRTRPTIYSTAGAQWEYDLMHLTKM